MEPQVQDGYIVVRQQDGLKGVQCGECNRRFEFNNLHHVCYKDNCPLPTPNPLPPYDLSTGGTAPAEFSGQIY